MTTTPLWVPLVVAAIGLVGAVGGTIAGVMITQRRADKREAIAWERQQQRERDVWAREDAARTFEHRREAYANFYAAHREMALAIYNHGVGVSEEPDDADEGDMPWDWQFPTFQKLQAVELYGSALVHAAAVAAYRTTYDWGSRAKYGDDDGDFYEGNGASDEAEEILRKAIRRDLSIPDEAISAAPIVASPPPSRRPPQ